jgi:hypothetical protein
MVETPILSEVVQSCATLGVGNPRLEVVNLHSLIRLLVLAAPFCLVQVAKAVTDLSVVAGLVGMRGQVGPNRRPGQVVAGVAVRQ